MSDESQHQISKERWDRAVRARIKVVEQEVARGKFDQALGEHQVAVMHMDMSCMAMVGRIGKHNTCDFFLPHLQLPWLHEVLQQPGHHVSNERRERSQALRQYHEEWRDAVAHMDLEMAAMARSETELADT